MFVGCPQRRAKKVVQHVPEMQSRRGKVAIFVNIKIV
jgi:hypothetical protein